MKRILGLIITVILLFSGCSCNTSSEINETSNPVIEIETDIEKENTETIEQTDKTPEAEPKQTNADKAEPCTVTLDNTFCKYTVIVTLTDEESSKKLSYTREDFPDIDIIGVYEDFNGIGIDKSYSDSYIDEKYYPDEYYPEYANKTTLYLMLKHPSKQNVLNAVKTLEKDSRVYSACPNAEIISEHTIYIYSDKELDDNEFSELGTIQKSEKHSAQLFGRKNCFYFSLHNDSELSLEQVAERLLENDKVKNIEYSYHCHWGEKVQLIFDYELWNNKHNTEYTVEDFPFLTKEDNITVHDMYLEISFKEYSKQRARDISEYMKANSNNFPEFSGDVTFAGSFGWLR